MADVTLEELRGRLGDDGHVLLDVRTQAEFEGVAQNHCDSRHGHIPGARNLPLEGLLECGSGEEVRALVALPEGVEVVAYCHVGSRSAFAVQVLQAAGYEARNYLGCADLFFGFGRRNMWPPKSGWGAVCSAISSRAATQLARSRPKISPR